MRTIRKKNASDILFFVVAFMLAYFTLVSVINRGNMYFKTGLGGTFFSNTFSDGTPLMVLELVASGYLLIYLNKLLHSNAVITKIVLLWILSVCISSLTIFTDFSFYEWCRRVLAVVLYWPLFYLFFYVYIKKNPDSWKKILVSFFLILLLCTFLFLKFYQGVTFKFNSLHLSLNVVYYPLCILPWILVIKKQMWRWIGVVFISVAVFLSLKRTAFVAYSMSLLVFMFVEYVFIQKKKPPVFRIIFVILIAFIFIFCFIKFDEYQDGYFTKRLENAFYTRGSQRTDTFAAVFEMQKKTSLLRWVVGNGHNMVVHNNPLYLSAHNDWQEVLFDYGIIGFFLYVLLHFCLLKNTYVLIRIRSPFAASFAASYVCFFFISLSGHLVLYPSYFIFIVSFWGSVIGLTECETKNENI